jgi:3D-(3,5/4)-trihydroxycyclohexane-1,2-dione acylhydrolase (decyclizing)
MQWDTDITQTAALALIREFIDKDAIVVGASGSLPGCMQRMWETDSLYSYNMEYGYSCMGYEIAGAFGSKLASPGREVYAMVGDGSYLMLHSELVTAVQEGIKIIVLLFDNGGFGCINNLQMGQGIKSLATEFRGTNGNFIKIDYAASAMAYGCKGYTVKSLVELANALKDAGRDTLPVLIDIKTLPKTMTHGYNSWWNVGCTSLPKNEGQEEALKERSEHLIKARKY